MMESGRVVRLVYMGDSITFGQYVDPALRWTSLIDQRLLENLKGRAVAIESRNQGVCGENTRLGLERFPAAVQQLRPEMLTLQYGMNDCNCWKMDEGLPRVSEAAFRANLVEMVLRARRFGSREVILATNPRTLRTTPMTSGEPYEEANARYAVVIREVAEETKVTLCDIRTEFDRYRDSELSALLRPDPDLLHLSVEGHRVYADALWRSMEPAVDALLGGGG